MNSKIDVRIVAVGFLLFATIARFMPHFYNMAAIGALGMFVGCHWSARVGFLMSVSAMALSDLVGHWAGVESMGFYSPGLMLCVYGAIGLAAFVGKTIPLAKKRLDLPMWFGVPCGALLATVVFFLITNFGAWLAMPSEYARTPAGLLSCYWLAIPFAKNTLIGNFLFSGLFFGIYAWLTAKSPEWATSKVDV